MQLKDIMEQLSKLTIVESRVMTKEYIELVFLNEDMGEWFQALEANLGQPRKPAGREPTQQDQLLTRQTGGIWVNQTLFEKDFGKVTVIAKFWPWADGVRTTLKMALLIH